MSINETRSSYLATLDRALRDAQKQGLSWLQDIGVADADATVANLEPIYGTVQALPSFDADGEPYPNRRGIWIKHPPVVAVTSAPAPLPPPKPPDPPPPQPPPPKPSPEKPYLSFSLYGDAQAPASWAQQAIDFAAARKFREYRTWANWRRPSDSARMVRSDGGIIVPVASAFAAHGAYADKNGMTVDLTFNGSNDAWDSFAAQLVGTVAVVTAFKGVKWIRYMDICNEFPGSGLSIGQLVALLAACRNADPDRKFTASMDASPSGAASQYAAIKGAGGEFDLVTPHFPRDAQWTQTATRVAQFKALLAGAGIHVPIHLQEENRLGSTGYQPRSADEFFTAAVGAFTAGAVEFCFHQDAGYVPQDGPFPNQLQVPIETTVADQIYLRCAKLLA